MEKLSEVRVQKLLTARSGNPFSTGSNFMVIPNVSWGFFSWGEADLIAITKSGYLTEGEVKLSITDFKADRKKKKFNSGHKDWTKDIRRHYYIVPEKLKDECLELLKDSKSGLLYLEQCKGYIMIRSAKFACVNREARKLTDKELLKLARLLSFRFWSAQWR